MDSILDFVENHPYIFALALVLVSSAITAVIMGLVYLIGLWTLPILGISLVLFMGWAIKAGTE